MPSDPEQKKTDPILRLHDYFKYMYEEEKRRTDQLNSATNTYLVFITFAFTFTAGLLNWLITPIKNLMVQSSVLIRSVFIVSISLAILLIVLSLILTILVVKVHRFERLCAPKDFALEMYNVDEESEILTSITSHYVVATERNYKVNNSKAKLLSYGLQAYISGFVLLMLSLITLILVNLVSQ